ncbi:MAG: hypothetical protein ACHQET_14090, partial [Chitinophagales bacterium]
MKNTILGFLFLFAILFACGQQNAADSLHAINEMEMLKTILDKHSHDTTELKAIKKLAKAYGDQWKIDSEAFYIKCGLNLEKSLHEKVRKDTDEVQWLIQVASMYRFLRLDSSNLVAKKALDLSRELDYRNGEWGALISSGENFRLMGDFPQAIEKLFNALRISRAIGNKEFEEVSLSFIGIAYTDLGDYKQGLYYLLQSKKMVDSLGSDMILTMPPYRLSYIGQAYEKLNMIDSALIFQQQALLLEEQGVALKNYLRFSPLRSWIMTRMGVIQTRLGNYPVALSNYREAIQIGDVLNQGMAQYQVAELYYTLNRLDSSLHYARLALTNNEKALEKIWMLASGELLTKIFKAKNKIDSAFRYQEITLALRDSLFGPDKFHRLQLLAINEQQEQQKIIQRQQDIQQEKERFESKIKIVALVAALGIFLLVATILYRNNRQKQKANALLESQKTEIQNALADLKSAQSQLI